MHSPKITCARPVRPMHRVFTAILLGFSLSVTPVWAASGQAGYLKISTNNATRAQKLSLGLNKSVIVDLPVDAVELIVSQPTIANAIMRSKRRAILQGMSGGNTNIFFLDGAGRNIAVLDIQVAQEPSPVAGALQATLARVLPGSNIRIETLSDNPIDGKTHFILTGTVQTAADKKVAETLATQLSDGGEDVGSLIEVVGAQQVMLKVTIAEVSRNVAKQFGINLNASMDIGGLSTGIVSGQTGSSTVGTANGVNMGGTMGAVTLEASLRALEARGALRTLAEPTLTAISGQPAEFLAGGQIPYRVIDADGNPTVTFKDYGAKLNFTPTIQSNGVIGLLVDTSVSEPVGDGALQQRSAKTSVELRSGQTLAIGGLIQDRVTSQISQFPGLGNIPILGALFRSRDFIRNQTELVILVTPYLAAPRDEAPLLPTDSYEFAGDAEATFLGHIEKMYGVGERGRMRGGYDGSVGFVLD